MMSRRLSSWTALLASLSLTSLLPFTLAQRNDTIAFAQHPTNPSNGDNIGLAVNVPAGENQKDLYFYFEADLEDQQWAAFGIGSGMDKSLMFVIYRSEDGTKATISPRLGSGHGMPQFTDAVNITILDSTISDDRAIVKFKCDNCRSWRNGDMDVTSTSHPFFYGAGSGRDIASDELTDSIDKHRITPTQFSLDLRSATGDAGVPNVAGTGERISTGDDNDDDDDDDDNDDYDDDYYYRPTISRGVAIHAFFLCFAFSIIYPGGYLFLRIFERVWLHWGIQSAGLLSTVVGIGAGIAVSIRNSISPNLSHPHQVIGLIVFALLLATWTLGLIGHIFYKRHGKPSPLMKGHRVLGPLCIFLGLVNACVGLAWAGMPRVITGYVMFNVLVAIVVGSLVFMKKKRKMRRAAMQSNAAHNFREGHPEGDQGHYPPPPAYGQAVPMQTFAAPPRPQQVMGGEVQRTEYYNVQPNK